MLATRTIIGMIVGGLIIGLGGYSLVDTLSSTTVSMNENFVIGSGGNASFSIPAPKDAHFEITVFRINPLKTHSNKTFGHIYAVRKN